MHRTLFLIAVVVMRRFPEQLLPVAHLGLERAEAIAEGREVGDPLRPRGQFEAGVVELSQKLVAAFGRLVHLFPERGGGALVGIGAPDRGFQRVGNSLEQQRVLVFAGLTRQQGDLAGGPPNTLRLSLMMCAPGSLRPQFREGPYGAVGRDRRLAVTGREGRDRVRMPESHPQMVRSEEHTSELQSL